MSQSIETKVPIAFKPLYTDDYTFYCLYGGRGGGKTEEVAKYIVVACITQRVNVLCIREVQKSIKDSVKKTLEKWIDILNLGEYFYITLDGIQSKNGSNILFKGMQHYNAGNIKSISDVDITWIEEANYFSKKSWELLIPSVLRTKKSRVIVTFNPEFKDAIVFQKFIINTPPPQSYVRKINYDENPYFKDSKLELERAYNEKELPIGEYRHIWLGEIREDVENSLWNNGIITKMVTNQEYNHDNYISTIIACDPATTNKEHSNEYGVIVLGITKNGEIHAINDASDVLNPFEFVNIVIRLFYEYNCESIVVEVNNGGDFIKHALLTADPSLKVIEVRASADKVNRAIPVANLAHMGRIKHIAGGFTKLERQMKLLTTRGFIGSRGESPDRLDAYVWGVYHLAGLKDKDTVGLVIPTLLNSQKPFKEVSPPVIYCDTYQNYIVYIMYQVCEKDMELFLNILQGGFCKNITDAPLSLNAHMIVKNTPLNSLLINEVSKKWAGVITYEGHGASVKDLEEKVNICLPFLKSFIRLDDGIKDSDYENERGNHFKLQLYRYSYNQYSPMINLICDIIKNEKGL